MAGAVAALAVAVLLARTERADRDAGVSDQVADFATEDCTP